MRRRLAAILVADVAGYSKLASEDEVGAVRDVAELRARIIESAVAQYGGRLVKTMGDGFLLEFTSAHDALSAALQIQSRPMGSPEDGAILLELRVGLHVGDVIVSEADIFGNGVNIACRLEALAAPGGLCMSRAVWEQVRGDRSLVLNSLGPQSLKNLTEPVEVWAATRDDIQQTVLAQASSASGPAGIIIPSASDFASQKSFEEAGPKTHFGTAHSDILPAGVKTDTPSLIVIPFRDLSESMDQEFLADGLTEDVITELSRFRNLYIVARNTALRFKGSPIAAQSLGARLGVQYVLEGSIRRHADRIRVSCELLEAATGSRLWSERYDRTLGDIFQVQDDLVSAISSAIPGHLQRTQVLLARQRPTEHLSAYLCELRGRWALQHTTEGLTSAIRWLETAIELDPEYAAAHAGLAHLYAYSMFVLGDPPEVRLPDALSHIDRALLLDDTHPGVHQPASLVFTIAGQWARAEKHARKAVALNPHDPRSLNSLGVTLAYRGQLEESERWFKKSAEVLPYSSDDSRIDTLCDFLYMTKQYDQAVTYCRELSKVPPHQLLPMAAAQAQLGDDFGVSRTLEVYARDKPCIHDSKRMAQLHIGMCERSADRAHWLEGYQKAGIL